MSTPIPQPVGPGQKEVGMSRFEKEKIFIMHNVAKRLHELNFENYFYLAKSVTFWFGVMFAVVGIICIMRGLQLTPLFAADPFDMTYIITGGCFCVPMLLWFAYVFLLPVIPSIGRKRKAMRDLRRERKNPSLFNDMVRKAEENSRPPVKKIRIYLMFRKAEFSVVAHTVEEMCEQIEYRTGLRPGQQLFKLSNEEVDLPLESILEDDLGISDCTRFDLYNRGGYVHDIKVSPECRMKTTRDHPDHHNDEQSIMSHTISKFKRDPYAYHKQLSVGPDEGSFAESSSPGQDLSTLSPSRGAEIGSVAPSETHTRRSMVEEKKKSGFEKFMQKSSKVSASYKPDHDEMSALTMNDNSIV